MKEIHLGRVLSENRRRKGVTQDELAEFMGVSKAAVSKWRQRVPIRIFCCFPGLLHILI